VKVTIKIYHSRIKNTMASCQLSCTFTVEAGNVEIAKFGFMVLLSWQQTIVRVASFVLPLVIV
jgi:hypothetical protein